VRVPRRYLTCDGYHVWTTDSRGRSRFSQSGTSSRRGRRQRLESRSHRRLSRGRRARGPSRPGHSDIRAQRPGDGESDTDSSTGNYIRCSCARFVDPATHGPRCAYSGRANRGM
jgi:hypothetical protein